MALSPFKFREILFQLLYSHDFAQSGGEEMIELLMEQLAVTKKTVRDAHERVTLILEKRAEIDPLIARLSTAYDFDRIPRAERNILRLSLYEMLFDPTVPPKVAIAEAIRLCRKFASPEAAEFVNALLDAFHQERTSHLPSGLECGDPVFSIMT